MADFRILVAVDSSGGRVRVPKGDPSGRGGQFAAGGTTDYRRLLRAQNGVMAREQQALVVETLDGSIQRRAVSSGRLRAVTGDPRNVQWNEFGYGVGREDFLDNSLAKYWRQIEEGYEGHVGRTIHGFWGANINRISGDRVYAAPPWSRHSSRRGDMFIAATGFREEGKFARYEGSGGRSGAPNFAKTTTIKNPIQAHHFYADAFRKYRGGQRALQAVEDVLAGLSEGMWTRRMQRRGHLW